jgi:spore maturation protein CgeB
VHEWNDHALVRWIGELRKKGGKYKLLFHDTHHRSVTDPGSMAAYDLSGYDGVLAFGGAIRDVYERRGWASRAWVWHEAADVRVFSPRSPTESDEPEGDVVWIGNWGDGERTSELTELLLAPSSDLGLRVRIHGVRYPEHAVATLAAYGAEYAGWLPNFRAPAVFARHAATVHVPRRPYVEALPGIPTIRVFEALACGIPLVSGAWDDVEGLFAPGRDFLVARTRDEAREHLRAIVSDEGLRRELAARGRQTILARHTCAHRADELMAIARALGVTACEPSKAPRREVLHA